MTARTTYKLKTLYHAARVCAEADRAQFLANACGGDVGLEQARLSDAANNDLTGRQLGS